MQSSAHKLHTVLAHTPCVTVSEPCLALLSSARAIWTVAVAFIIIIIKFISDMVTCWVPTPCSRPLVLFATGDAMAIMSEKTKKRLALFVTERRYVSYAHS